MSTAMLCRRLFSDASLSYGMMLGAAFVTAWFQLLAGVDCVGNVPFSLFKDKCLGALCTSLCVSDTCCWCLVQHHQPSINQHQTTTLAHAPLKVGTYVGV
jgi:hypothetical protein